MQDVSLPQRESLPLKHEAGVACIECQDRAIIPRIFLIARFENPPHVIFCMLQDYLVVAVGSLICLEMLCSQAVPGRLAVGKLTSLSVQGQKWSPVVLQLYTAECKFQDFLHSPFAPPIVSCIAAC